MDDKKHNNDFRILIVDDIPKNIQVLGNILRNESYLTGFATNGEQALKSLEMNKFDLVLLDVTMPGMDGYEVCRQIRESEKTRDIPVIFITANVEKDHIVKGFEAGAQDYITKPFNASELLARVNTHLELSDKRTKLANINQFLEQQVQERTEQLQEAYNKLEKASKKLGQLEKAKSDFLNIISHELRTPLNGILGFSEILKSSLKKPEHLEYLGYILGSADRLLHFSEIAITIAELSAERYSFVFEARSLNDILQTALRKLNDRVIEKNLNIKLEVPEEPVIYKCDAALFEIALINVVENAIKYSPENETIHISMGQTNERIELSVKDKGVGFSEEALAKLFEFFSADDVLDIKDGYFGLGLSVTKLILEAHGGDVDVKNPDEGGALVCFNLNIV